MGDCDRMKLVLIVGMCCLPSCISIDLMSDIQTKENAMSGREASVLELCSSQSDMSLYLWPESVAPIGRTSLYMERDIVLMFLKEDRLASLEEKVDYIMKGSR